MDRRHEYILEDNLVDLCRMHVDDDVLASLLSQCIITDADINKIKQNSTGRISSSKEKATVLLQMLKSGGKFAFQSFYKALRDSPLLCNTELAELLRNAEKDADMPATCLPIPLDQHKLNAAFADAVRRGGTSMVLFLHVVILGAAGSGKTSLLRSLLDELFDAHEISTIGMNIRLASSQIASDGKWVLLDDMVVALEQLLTTTLIQTQSSEQPPASVVPGPTPNVDAHSASRIMSDEPPDNEISEVIDAILCKDLSDYLKHAALERDFAVVSTCALGGEQVYQCAQPLLIGDNTTFVVTYDASLDLEAELVEQEVLLKKDRVIRRGTLSTATTPLVQLLTWFDYLLLRSTAKSRQGHKHNRALAVGCKNDIRILAKKPDPRPIIKSAIKDSPYKDVVSSHYYLVDNTKSGSIGKDEERDLDVQELRSMLNNRCKNDAQAIPVFWLRFAIAMTTMKRQSKMPWISFKDAARLALGLDSISHESQMESLLKYHHDAGHVAYFNTDKLKDIVILSPQFVLDCISAMLHVNFDSDDSPGWGDEKAYSRGFVTEIVAVFALEQQFNTADMEEGEMKKEKEEMREKWLEVKKTRKELYNVFKILEELSILVIIPADASASPEMPMFILPAAAERENAALLKEAKLDCMSSHMYIRLHGVDHFPAFVYWQCIVECLLEARRLGADITQTCLSLQEARLPWKKSEGSWLRLRYGKLGLRLQVERDSIAGPWPDNSTAGKEAAASVKQRLTDIVKKRKLIAVPEYSLPCPCGSQQGVTCVLHGLMHCATEGCNHMLRNVARRDTPKCSRRWRFTAQSIAHNAACFWLGLVQDNSGKLVDPPPATEGSEPPAVGGSARVKACGSGAYVASSLPKSDMQLSDCCNVAELAKGIDDSFAHERRAEFGRWAVQQVDKDMIGVEHNVLVIYLQKQRDGDLSICADWMDTLCVLHYLSNQRHGPTIDQVYQQLASLCHNRALDILKIFQDVAVYRPPVLEISTQEARGDTIIIPTHGITLRMDTVETQFPAGAVASPTPISPPVHMVFDEKVQHVQGKDITLHSVLVLEPHGTQFLKPVEVKVDVDELESGYEVCIVYYPDPSSTKASIRHSMALPDCTVLHIAQGQCTIISFPKGAERSVALDNLASKGDPQSPFSQIRFDYDQKAIRLAMDHFSSLAFYSTEDELTPNEITRLVEKNDLLSCQLFVYAEKTNNPGTHDLHVTVVPRYGHYLTPPPEPRESMNLAGKSRLYFLLEKTSELAYRFSFPHDTWSPAVTVVPRQPFNVEASARFLPDCRSPGWNGSYSASGDLRCRRYDKDESPEDTAAHAATGEFDLGNWRTITATITYEDACHAAPAVSSQMVVLLVLASVVVLAVAIVLARLFAPEAAAAAASAAAPPATAPIDLTAGIRNGHKQLGACDVKKLASSIQPLILHEQDDFARWAVQFVDKSKTGLEYGVLKGYLEGRGDSFSPGTTWSSIWCVLSYLENQEHGPTIDEVYAKLVDLCYGRRDDFLRIFKDEAMYR